MVRDVSVSCAELKLVMVRAAKPRQRSTVEEPELGLRAQGQGRDGDKRGIRQTGQLGLPRWIRKRLGQGALGARASQDASLSLLPPLPLASLGN